MKNIYTLSSKLFFISIFLFSFKFSYSDEVTAMLRQWAAYSGIADSTFKTPVVSEEGYTYVATVDESSITGVNLNILKYDNTGHEVWRTNWSGTGYGRDQAADMVMDSLYLYICGATYSAFSNFDYLIMKIRKSDGNIQWVQTFNGTLNTYDIATALVVHDTSVYVTGVSSNLFTMQDYGTLKLNAENGNILWGIRFDYNNLLDIPFAIDYSEDDTTFIVTGGSQSNIIDWDYQTNIYKYNGTIVDEVRESGASVGFDRAQAVKIDGNGNIYITGATYGSSNNYDIKTVKLDKHGTLIWEQTYNFNGDDIGNDLLVNESGVYVCGITYGIESDYFVMKLDLDHGSIVWDTSFEFAGNDTARAMCFDSRGNIVITGQSVNNDHGNYDFLTINLNSENGEILWKDYFNGPDNGDDNATNISSNFNGDIFVTGQVCGTECQTVTIKYKTDFFTHPPAVDTPSIQYLFFPNSGQLLDMNDSLISDSVHYYSLHHNPQLLFGFGKMNMVWGHVYEDSATSDTLQRVDVTFANSSNVTEAYPIDEQDSAYYVNYFLPQCPNGITNVYGYGSLLFTDVYSGIDAIYSSNNSGLKLLFLINPGSVIPDEIGLTFEGDSGISIVNNWGLNVHTTLGDYAFEKPNVYQIDTNGVRKSLPWHLNWNIPHSGTASLIGWAGYDNTLPLIVEIARTIQVNQINSIGNLQWCTFFGGTLNDNATCIKSDGLSSLYSSGHSYSPVFPTTPGAFSSILTGVGDIFINKFIQTDRLNWCTFYGGSSNEFVSEIAVDDTGVYAIGTTFSSNIPIRSTFPMGATNRGCYQSEYILKISLQGNNLLWSNYIADTLTCNGSILLSVDVDKEFKNVYVAGYTYADQLPMFPPQDTLSYYQNYHHLYGILDRDGIIYEFDRNGTPIWSTYFGSKYGADLFTSIKVCGSKLFVGGRSSSYVQTNNFCGVPTNDGFPSCYPSGSYNLLNGHLMITEFDLSGHLTWSTHFGPSGYEQDLPRMDAIQVGNNYDLFFLGSTQFSGYPYNIINGSSFTDSINSGDWDMSLVCFRNRYPQWGTLLGGDSADFGMNLTHDDENIYFIGKTRSSISQNASSYCTVDTSKTFPLCDTAGVFFEPQFQNFFNQNLNIFIGAFNRFNYKLRWNTYFAETLIDAREGMGITYSSAYNSLYIADETLNRYNLNFPIVHSNTANPYTQDTNLAVPGNGANAFYARFGNMTWVNNDEITEKNILINIFPNPSNNGEYYLTWNNNKDYLKLSIYDYLGRLVAMYPLPEHMSRFKFSIASEQAGFYLVNIESNKLSYSKKIVYIK